MLNSRRIGSWIGIAAALLFVTDLTFAQRVRPATLPSTVTVQDVSLPGSPGAPFTLLGVVPGQIGHSRYAPYFSPDTITITFLAHAELRSISAFRGYVQSDSSSTLPGAGGSHYVSAHNCKDTTPAYSPGIHNCSFPIGSLFNEAPAATSKSRSKIGDRVALMLEIVGEAAPRGSTFLLVTVPVKSVTVSTRRSASK